MHRLNRPGPLARAHAVAPAIVAAADEIERSRRYPGPLAARLHESGLLRLLLPASLGGDQAAPGDYLEALAVVAEADGSVGWNMFVSNSSALIAPFIPAETARAIFADPAGLVAWGPPNTSRAQAVPGGYRVSGTWDFASGCRQASWLGAHCPVQEPDGSLRLNSHGKPAVRTLLFPVAQAELHDTWDTIGLRGTASDSYSVKELFVPEARSGTREEPQLRRERGKLYAFPMQGLYAVGVAGVALGIARGMLRAFIDLALRKSPRGLGRLADSVPVQAALARHEARLGAGHAYLLATLAQVHAEADEAAPLDMPQRGRVRLACTHAIHEAIGVADFAFKAAGVDAIFPGSPFERRFRDIHTLSQQVQAREVHYELVGQVMLGQPPEVFY
ncbi:MAG: acyl-CoA dehydrogenase [Alphaproteobacteria bacterium]|nr:acyl-CoA dehydrogenase [Alphaproteobacteria bacterium]